MRLIKFIGLNLIMAYIGIGAIVNVFRQYNIIKQAKVKNAQLKEQIVRLDEENHKYKLMIDYATSSAYLDQQVRDKLGLGKPGDVWIKIGATDSFTR